MTDQQILSGAGPTPVAITLDVAQRLLPKLAFAAFDGTGAAGDFLPVVKFVGPGGLVAGQAVGDVVTAGASVDQTWFRGLAKQTGEGGTTGREILGSVGNTTIPGPGFANLPWSKVNGNNLLDLTNPLLPKMVADGIYAVTATVSISTLVAGPGFRLQLTQNGSDFADALQSSPPRDANQAEPYISCTLVHHWRAGQLVIATVYNFDTMPQDFYIASANVQRIS